MTKFVLTVLIALAMAAVTPSRPMLAVDNGQAPPPPSPPAAAPAQPTRPVSPAPPAPPPPPPTAAGNLQLDLAITDTRDGKPDRKVLTMIVRDGARSSIRSSGAVLIPPVPGGPPVERLRDVSLNLDATATRLANSQINVSATFEFTTTTSAADQPNVPVNLTQVINVSMRNGQTLLVSRSADPVSDRTVTVELTATIREP